MSSCTINPYEYMDETSIFSDLICSICREPYKDPCCTPCDHIFCRECVTHWIQRQSQRCPNCRRRVVRTDIQSATRIIHNVVNDLRVKCTQCGQKELKRSDIDEHIRTACPKSITSCSSVNIKCPWIGQRDQLDEHLSHCMSNRLATFLDEFHVDHQQVKRKLAQLETKCAQEDTKLTSTLNDIDEEVNTITMTRNSELTNFQTKVEEFRVHIQSDAKKLDTCKQQIKKMKTKHETTHDEISNIKEKFKQNEIEIKHLTIQSHLMQVLLFGNRSVALENRILQQQSNSSIDLAHLQLIDPDMDIVVTQAIQEKQCKELRLRQNLITEEGVFILVNTLKLYPTLEILDFAYNHIHDDGVNHLAHILSLSNSNLIKLELDSNAITDVGANSLAESLKTNQTLQYLSLSKNIIDDQGMESLATVLTHDNRTLKELYLNGNKLITNSTINSFIYMIQNNQSLEILNVKYCGISEENKIKLQQIVKYKSNFLLHI